MSAKGAIDTRNLLAGDIPRQIRGLAIPLSWGLVSLTLFSVIDTWFIGRLGTEYLAAFGFTIPVVMLFMGVIFGLAIGTTSVLSRVYGSGNVEKLRQMSTDALFLALILSVVCAVIGFFCIDNIFRLMGAPDDLLPMIDEFMMIWYCGLPFLGMQIIGNSCIRATGDTRFPASMMMLTTLITVVLDPFLIYGWAGLPRLELAGAALTLVIAYLITWMISMYRLAIKRRVLSARIFHPGLIASWKSLLHVGVPSIASNIIAPMSFAIVAWMAAGFGKTAIAALGVATRIEGLVTIFFYAVAAGTSIFAGQNFGAGNFGRVREAARVAGVWSLVMGGAFSILLFIFAEPLARLFDSNPEVVHYAAQYLRLVPVSYAALGVMILCNAIFNAVGKPGPATFIIVLKAFVLYVPLAYVLQEHAGFTGILIAISATNILTGILAYVWNKKAIS